MRGQEDKKKIAGETGHESQRSKVGGWDSYERTFNVKLPTSNHECG